jgi:hypothetical protein
VTSRTTKRWAVPLALALVYIAALALTAQLSNHPTQPLFEGVGPTAPYRWAKPPPEFAATNQPPGNLDVTAPLDANGSTPISSGSHDGQLVLNLSAGAFPPADGATSVHVLGTPLDPATLGALPAPLRSDGNAYQVNANYLPTNAAATVAKPGNIVLVVPEAADAIYYSQDGKTWERRDTQTVGGPSTVGTVFDKPGYYLAGTTAPPLSAATSSGGSSWTSILVVAGTALLVLLLIIVPTLWWRSRNQKTSAKRSRQVRRNLERKQQSKRKR